MRRLITAGAAMCVWLGGCATDPLAYDSTRELREQVIRTQQAQIRATNDAKPREVEQPTSDSYLYEGETKDERVKQLDEISGRSVYHDSTLDVRTGLDGEPSGTAALSLEHATRTALRHNVPVQQARLLPAISEARVVAAEAVFDAVFFTDFNYAHTDQPQPASAFGGLTVGSDARVAKTAALTTGIRKPLESGGQVTVSTGFEYSDDDSPNLSLAPNPAFTSNILVGVEQPLLRNFGSKVNRTQILLSRNAHRREMLTLHAQLLSTLAQVEQAYWQLYLARHELAIQQRLLDLTIETRDKVYLRYKTFDATPVQMAQAQSFVELRKVDVIRARRALRTASDQLKSLLYDPQLPLAEETMIVPIDQPVEVPVKYNLVDAVTTGLQKRPEIRAALLEIDDASIRTHFADNQRLPELNLSAQTQVYGLDDDFDESYVGTTDGDYINYLVGLQFETPIGNRAAEADFRVARLERKSAVLRYQQTVQDVVLGIKESLRALDTSWRLIGVNRDARRAAAENLRVLQERDKEGEAQTPEFLLDLMLNAQQRLADAELRELQSIVEYNLSLLQLNQQTGTLLEHNQVQIEWPETMFNDE